MAGKIDGSPGLRPLGTVASHAPAQKADKADKAAADKKKEGEAVPADPKGWKAQKQQQANPHAQSAPSSSDGLRHPKELTSNLGTLHEAAEIPGRFATDLEAARPELVNYPGLLRTDKAQRLFEFAVPYAQAVVTKSETPVEKKEVSAEMLISAEQHGYGLLQPLDPQDPSAKNGLAALRELLEKQTPEELAQKATTYSFDIPSWPSDAQMLAEARAAAAEQQLNVQPGLQPVANAAAPFANAEDDERAQRDGTTNKRLGSNTLWNVLHLFRDDGKDDRESAKQREEKSQAFWIAALVFVLLAVIVVAFVSM
jgi:hypothetical protein